MDSKKIRQTGKKIYTAWKVLLWILRWISIVFFGVLFFVGVYFKLPWKVLACIAVIPLVGVFVPKKIQPWVWGGLTVLIVALWGWVHLPEHNSKDWRPYEYTDDLNSIEKDYLLPEAENAADRYSAVFEQHGENIFTFNFHKPNAKEQTLSGPWDPQANQFLDFWISDFDEATQQLVEAATIEQCRFEIPYNLASMKPQLQRINQFKGWTRLMIRSANRNLFIDNQQQALDKLLAVTGMAQHLYQQQTLFDQAGAFHIELLGARAMFAFIINQCDDPGMLNQIERAFVDLDPQWAQNWSDILAREKLTAKNLAALMYEVNNSGKIRISHNAMMALQEGLGFYPRRLFLNQHVMNRLAVIGLWLTLPVSPQRLADIIDERFDHYSLRVQKGEQLSQYTIKYVWIKGLNAQSVIDWLAMQQVGYFWALDGQFQRHESIVNQIKIVSALKRYYLEHNNWPEQLTDVQIEDATYVLNDPLCGKPFVYEKIDEGFRFYSLGANAVDDGGLNDPGEKKDDILLWPRDPIETDVVKEKDNTAIE